MATQIKRKILEFLAADYRTTSRRVEILWEDSSPYKKPDRKTVKAQPDNEKNFIQRWYLSLQGEDNPVFSRTASSPKGIVEQRIYRYDWAFGITVIEGYWWDWKKELAEQPALAIHVVLEPIDDAPGVIPISATLSALHPSRNTPSTWERWQKAPKAVAEMAKAGVSAIPTLKYVASGLMLTSNILDSYTGEQKNWYLYQFFDEQRNCPAVEWRINRKVIDEYGPLLRGTLFVAFHGSSKSGTGGLRMLLRPQIRYCPQSDLDYIIPTDKLEREKQVFIDVKPKDQLRGGTREMGAAH